MIEFLGWLAAAFLIFGFFGIVVGIFVGWLSDIVPNAFMCCAIGMVFFIIWGGFSEGRQKADFMRACTQDRKEYECTAMWRGAASRTSYVPVVTPMIVR